LLNSSPSLPSLPSLEPVPTAAERAAALIREYIFEGKFQPGLALPEASLAASLHVSRNTVREAYRTLMNERLLIYSPHKGVTVRWLSPSDVRDIYALRRVLEFAAVDALSESFDSEPLAAAVADARVAADKRRWHDVGTANLRFHAALVATLGSMRATEFFAGLMTELRLGFLAVADPPSFHGSFLTRNEHLLTLLSAGSFADARAALEGYLADAEIPVITAASRPLRLALSQVAADLLAKAAGLAGVQEGPSGRAGQQRSERERAAPRAGGEPSAQQPGDGRPGREQDAAWHQRDAATARPRGDVHTHPVRRAAGRGNAVDLVQFGDQLDLDADHHQGLGRDLSRERGQHRQHGGNPRRPARRRGRPRRTVDERVRDVLSIPAGELLAQLLAGADLDPRRHGQHLRG
jgi:DNA-binding GntR family transcriptional regulator